MRVRAGWLKAICCAAPLCVLGAAAAQESGSRGSPLEVADAIDRVLRPRFMETDFGFGMSRIPTLLAHSNVRLAASTKLDREALQVVEESRKLYAYGLVHCEHPMGHGTPAQIRAATLGRGHVTSGLIWVGYNPPRHPPDPGAHGGDAPKLTDEDLKRMAREEWEKQKTAQAALRDAAELARTEMPRLLKGKIVEREFGEWFLSLRPVTGDKATCVSCHEGAKPNQTLGILAYAVSARDRVPSGL